MQDRNQRRRWTIRSLMLALSVAVVPMGAPTAAHAQSAVGHPEWPGPGQLFVGTCYQPIDRSPAQIKQDIALTKAAGFNMVRMGDLSWDSFEPEEGRFTFQWFDDVLKQMHATGIRVIVDIPGQPAPIWLHKAYPGVDIVSQEGDVVNPASRYWDNISDLDYRRLAHRLAEKLLQRYANIRRSSRSPPPTRSAMDSYIWRPRLRPSCWGR